MRLDASVFLTRCESLEIGIANAIMIVPTHKENPPPLLNFCVVSSTGCIIVYEPDRNNRLGKRLISFIDVFGLLEDLFPANILNSNTNMSFEVRGRENN